MFSRSPMPRPIDSRKFGGRDVDVGRRRLHELEMARPGGSWRDRELGDGRLTGRLGRLPHRRAQEQHHRRAARELELGLHLRAVEGPRGHDRAALSGHLEDVARETGPELCRHGRPETHAVDGEAEQGHLRLALGQEGLEGSLGGVGLELLRIDSYRDDLVDAGEVGGRGERPRIACDHRQRHRAAELAGGGDELACDVTELSLQVLGDDQDPAHDSRALTISAIREATSAGVSPSGSAPSPRVARTSGVPGRRARPR